MTGARTSTRDGRAPQVVARRAGAARVRLPVAVLGALVVALAGLLDVEPAAAFAPDVNYALHCQGCHLADGKATPGLVPALEPILGRMMRVPEGRAYVVRLPNVVAAQIDATDTAALLNWLLARFAASELDASFVPIGVAEVEEGRRAPLVDVDGARREVLRRLESAR